MTVVSTTAQVPARLTAARRLVGQGWCQGYLEQETVSGHRTAYCVIGAILFVTGISVLDTLDLGGWTFLPEVQAFAHANGLKPLEIDDWNDARTRRHEEVLGAFDKAIAYAQERAKGVAA